MAWTDLVDEIVARAFGTFSESVLLTVVPGSTAIALSGIYSEESVAVALGDGAVVTTLQRGVDLRNADVPGGVKQGMGIEIRGRSYVAIDVQGPDDAGIVRITLHAPPRSVAAPAGISTETDSA